MAQKRFIIDGGFSVNDDSLITGNLEMAGHILPSADITYDLGSPTKQWKDVYVGPGSLYVNGKKVIEDDSDTITLGTDADQDLRFKTTGVGSIELLPAGTGNIQIMSTMQIQTGSSITDSAGSAVKFGDKIDMDSNRIINVTTPVDGTDAANKTYVDDKFDDVINGAPAALDTLNELAAALGDDANYASTITTALAAKASIVYVDAQIAGIDVSSQLTGVESDIDALELTMGTAALNTTAQNVTGAINELKTEIAGNDSDITTANTNIATNTAAIGVLQTTTANNATDIAANSTAITNAISTASADATAKANNAEANATATAQAYTNTRETAITSAYQTYADTAEADAVSTAETYTNARETAITAVINALTTDDVAEGTTNLYFTNDRVDTKLGYVDADILPSATETYNLGSADKRWNKLFLKGSTIDLGGVDISASGTGMSVGGSDMASQSYVDGKIADLIASAPGALDTLNELAAAMGDDANFSATVVNNIATAKAEAISNASADATTKADAAEADAISTASADATTKANAAQTAATSHSDNRDITGVSFNTGTGVVTFTRTSGDLTVDLDGRFTDNAYADAMNQNVTTTSDVTFGSVYATGDVTAYSDESLKTNIKTIDGALGKVESIRGITFDRINDGSTSTGVVAQELESVLPEAVKTDAHGLKSVAYGNITGLLIEAVKELSAQVAELKAKK
ncbi:MAG: hypothetical protein CBD16_09775 [Betaproteobacteria bacterium TMED156]|nr:MAG: hypothetical protein CBD16_09775 [Betaproteobacteria bacterium TMED156]